MCLWKLIHKCFTSLEFCSTELRVDLLGVWLQTGFGVLTPSYLDWNVISDRASPLWWRGVTRSSSRFLEQSNLKAYPWLRADFRWVQRSSRRFELIMTSSWRNVSRRQTVGFLPGYDETWLHTRLRATECILRKMNLNLFYGQKIGYTSNNLELTLYVMYFFIDSFHIQWL
jgi:hypothetical protein